MLRATAPRAHRGFALGAIVLTAALWGLSMPLTKSLMEVYQPCTLAVLRLAIALAVLLPVLFLQGKRPLITRESIVLGATGVALFQILQNTGMQSVSAGGSVIVLYGGVVMMTAILGRCVLGEQCSWRTALALLASAAGVGLVALDVRNEGGSGMHVMGVGLILAAAGAFAVYTVIGRGVRERNIASLNAGMLLVGLVAIAPLAVRERQPGWQAVRAGPDLVALVALGAVVTAGSYFCWCYGLRHVPVTEASVLSSGEPVFGLLFAWLLLRETVTMREGLGAAIIIGSCVVVALAERGDVAKPGGLDEAPAGVD